MVTKKKDGSLIHIKKAKEAKPYSGGNGWPLKGFEQVNIMNRREL